MSQWQLTKSETNQMIAGVCGGLGEYLGVDVTLVRLGFVVLGFASGVGLPLYILLMILVPHKAMIDEPTSKVVQDNLGRVGGTVSATVEQIRQDANRRNTAAFGLIILGSFLLLEQLHLPTDFLWPLIFIGLGVAIIWPRR